MPVADRMIRRDQDSSQKRKINLPPKHHFPPIENPSSMILDLPKIISELLDHEDELAEPVFQFKVSSDAAEYNYSLLSSSNFELEQLLNPKSHCITSYGSEFKSE